MEESPVMPCITCGRTTTLVDPASALAFCCESHLVFYSKEVRGQTDRQCVCDKLESAMKRLWAHLDSPQCTPESGQELWGHVARLVQQVVYRYDPPQLTMQLSEALQQYTQDSASYAAALSVSLYAQRMHRLTQSFSVSPRHLGLLQQHKEPWQAPGQDMLSLLWPHLHLTETLLCSILSLQYLLYVLYALNTTSRTFHNAVHLLFGMTPVSSILNTPVHQPQALSRHMTQQHRSLVAGDDAEAAQTPLLLLHTALFLRHDLALPQDLQKRLHDEIGLEVHGYDSRKQSLVELVNLWCQQTSDNHIPQCLDAGAPKDVAALLVNALYFDARWIHPFEPRLTTTRRFTRLDGTQMRLAQMHQPLVTLLYYETPQCQYLQLPYRRQRETDDQWALFVALPRRIDGEPLCSNLQTLLPQFHAVTVKLWLPRWQQQSKLDTALLFKALELDQATVTLRAAKTMQKVEMRLTRVLQRVAFAVDELGTEASVVTVGELAELSRPPRAYDVLFDASHAFAYTLMNVTRQVRLIDGVYNGQQQ
jgi:serine protease inhibitor